MNTAVVAGHICLDVIPQMPPIALHTALTPGSLVEIGPVLLSTGGPVSNTGRNLHRLGIPTRLMGKVGDDRFGDIILGLIRDDDPALAEFMIRAPGETSSYSIVISPPGMDRFFLHCPGANHTFSAADVDYDVLRESRLFHFGYPPFMRRMYSDEGAELIDLFRRAKETGVLTSLDLALPDPNGPSGRVNWRHILQQTLPYVDFFLPSLDELLFMLHCDPDVSMVGSEALALGAKVVVLKLGDRGLYVRTGPEGSPHAPDDPTWKNRELWAPCFVPDPLVGTTGAGDATIAGFLAAVLRGQSIEAALTSAVGVGACNVEAADALSGVRSWEATQARIQAGWKRAALTIENPGWRWNQDLRLWLGPNDH
jgi:sugar/nucleoside kinase (ribokinase family)